MLQSPLPQEMHTIRDCIRWSISQMSKAEVFFGHGYADALDESTALVLHSLALPHDLPGHFMDAAVSSEEKQRIAKLLHQRTQDRMPLSYITHESWFAGLCFFVDQRVLIPRSPIGELIESGFEGLFDIEPLSILDLCTGSGCIAIACADAFPQAEVDAVDLSEDALAVADKNRQELGFEDQVELIRSDLFSALEGRSYDLIVSNPPYVDQYEMDSMPDEFHHEPRLGLTAGDDGLDLVHRILAEAADYLNPGGVLICEVGVSDQALIAAYPDVPFTWIEFQRGGGGVFMLTKEQLAEIGGE
ncbi:MAG: 50S ribosomal protein L3 N(5)-glutamine methyltransferase [Gammaproteobacteria bacterium]|nr:50S ribosomal protein L3 N(5)-glutamine methyltransferase [Gammaproteobacteria bacterium]